MPRTFAELIEVFLRLIGLLLPLLIALAFLVFVWGIAKFIARSEDSKSHEEGKSLIKWGLVGLFVMLSFMGIIRLFYEDIGFSRFGLPLLPPYHIAK
ncbi:hypothetical protein KW796_00320 [Candidatus Parcubacteria bacterium]|nr:hypothetical protein [Candidatus Parcubacteria bacterium]